MSVHQKWDVFNTFLIFLFLQVNKTFQDFQILKDVHEAWQEVGPRIKTFMESSVEIRLLQDLLRRPEVAVVVNLRLENTSWTASRISRFLSTPDPDTPRRDGAPPTWLDLYQDLNNTFSTLSELTTVLAVCGSCYDQRQ